MLYKELRDKLRAIEVQLRVDHRRAVTALGPGTDPGPARAPALALLARSQTELDGRLAAVNKVFWGADPRLRPLLADTCAAVLGTLLQVAGDVYAEAVFAAEGDEQAIAERTKAYDDTVRGWLQASPHLDPRARAPVGNAWILPKVVNRQAQPYLRTMARSAEAGDFWEGTQMVAFRDRVRAAVKADLRTIAVDPDADAALSRRTVHLLGLVFVRAQLELTMRSHEDSTNRSDVDSWYRSVVPAVETVRGDIVDVAGPMLRDAVLDGAPLRAARLSAASTAYLRELAATYSLRVIDAATLLAFFVRQFEKGPFGSADEVVGVNKVVETITSYVGLANRDDQDARKARGVVDVRAKPDAFVGHRVRVFGLLDPTVSRLRSERTAGAAIDLQLADDRARMPYLGRGDEDRRVLATGTLEERAPGKLLLRDATLAPHVAPYAAGVGFPYSYGLPLGSLPTSIPLWRQVGPGMAEAWRDEQREGAKNLPDVLDGQHQLVNDLLRRPEVRRELAGAARAGDRLMIDLQDTPTRTRVWRTVFTALHQADPPTALAKLFEYLGRYLRFYTRHTYFNLRDKGPNYVTSPWPEDLTGSVFHDCGVYAVRTAYDLFHAVSATPVVLEFRYVTFLNHVCLVGITGDRSFLLNNDRLYAPAPVARLGAGGPLSEAEKLGTCFGWARLAYPDVYNVAYSVFPVAAPGISVTTARSEAAFRSDVFDVYLKSIGWGVAPHEAELYLRGIREFHDLSGDLDRLLKTGLDREPATSASMTRATTLATRLYTLADGMTHPTVLQIEPQFARARATFSVGFARRRTLPMYDFVDHLRARRARGERLAGDQAALANQPVRQAHVDFLSDPAARKPAQAKP